MRKNVDKSFLTRGFSIQKSERSQFIQLLSNDNDSKITTSTNKIKLRICDFDFEASIVKEEHKYSYLQVRYDNNQQLTSFLQKIFFKIWDYISTVQNPKKRIIPDNIKETVQIIPFIEDNVCEILLPLSISENIVKHNLNDNDNDEITKAEHEEAKTIPESVFEDLNDKDEGYRYSLRIQKRRNAYIQNVKRLKKWYSNRCQITGKRIGGEYGVDAVEVHHIKPFCESLNSNLDNLVVLSPDFHRIIHQSKATFDYDTLEFIINGKRVKLKLDEHLRKLKQNNK